MDRKKSGFEMGGVLLSINIPTYNRVGYLRSALNALIPQKSELVEINVTDNHSTDGTWEYLESLDGVVNRFRPSVAINGNYNILSCAEIGTGMYTWVHCDDDIARLNAVENLLRAIREFGYPPVLTFRWDGYNKDMDGFVNTCVDAKWIRCDKNEFLRRMSYRFTFASAIVLKRGEIDIEYVKNNSPANLIPANMIFSTAARSNCVVLTESCLLAARGNPGRHELLTTFTKDMWKLFNDNRKLGYDTGLIRQVYDESLRTVVPHAVEAFPVTWKSAFSSFIFSARYPAYYKYVLPRVLRKLTPSAILRGLKGVKKVISLLLYPFKKLIGFFVFWFGWVLLKILVYSALRREDSAGYLHIRNALDHLCSQDFKAKVALKSDKATVSHPTYLHNPNYVEIGANFFAGPGLRLEAWDRYREQRFQPVIRIGDNVCINWNCHIGAIDRIEIHDNVLIGSNVLITDHSHGEVNVQDLSVLPAQRPLFSKGPVVIERDVWIGEGVAILPGVRIGEGSIIGANSVVTSDVAKFSVVVGVPGRVIKTLKVEESL